MVLRPTPGFRPAHFLQRSLVTVLWTAGALGQLFWYQPAQAQTTAYCWFTEAAIAEKESLHQAVLQGEAQAQSQYEKLLQQHAAALQQCRRRAWPQSQAIWLRLYPCDIQPGRLEQILDRIVNRGYDQVYVEVFYDGQVLLPAANNPTVWPSVLRNSGAENVDLLEQAIQKGHQRGLKVYAWMFTMNFGYTYSLRADRQQVLARNGQNDTSLSVRDATSTLFASESLDQVFIDPYNRQAKLDYYQLVQAILQRKPDGVLFDYIRYPRIPGAGSVAEEVKDLWIYGAASRQALYDRALNQKGREIIRRYVEQGYITVRDIEAIDRQYPKEKEPLWQGRRASTAKTLAPANARYASLREELWLLSVAHAFQGVLDFLALATLPVQRQGIPAGAVFFPGGNRTVGQLGFDSRLQPWDRFPATIEWHPMLYATCDGTDCIVAEAKEVLEQAASGTQVAPVLAGAWGQSVRNRPSLEAQMQAIRQAAPGLRKISHFAFSWQEPELANERKFCNG